MKKWGRFVVLFLFFMQLQQIQARVFEVTGDDPDIIYISFFDFVPTGGDTIFINPNRKRGITFEDLCGSVDQPIVIINKNEQVVFEDLTMWSGFLMKGCRYIKITGTGSADYHYGFKLSAYYSGVNFSDECSNCEVEFVEIDHEGFVGIIAKDDYKGMPPTPIPVFEELVIHDCYIHNVTEGMYLGETVSPGMEFKHVKIYNNIIDNTGREGVQIANMVEDVEIYNNLIMLSGNDSLFVQGNNIQIGDNSVAEIYNNILMGAPEYGVIIFGSGNINVKNNYMKNNLGVFVDNRLFTSDFTSISILGNYFSQLSSNQVVLNYNEKNEIVIQNNQYHDSITFYRSNCTDCTNIELTNNNQNTVANLQLKDTIGGVFEQELNNDALYQEMGPQSGLGHSFNDWPVFSKLEDFYFDAGFLIKQQILATVDDGDSLVMKFEGLPDFVTFNDSANGMVELIVNSTTDDIGIYEVKATVTELSGGVKLTKLFEIVVRNANNQSPTINVMDDYRFSNLVHNTIAFSVIDPDDDLVEVGCDDLPSFVQLIEISNEEYQLQVAPAFYDTGSYSFSVVADDGYGGSDEQKVQLSVYQKELTPGQVVYRINFGGPELYGIPLNWEDGTGTYVNYSAENFHSTGSYSWKGVNTTQAPDSLFGPYSYCSTDTQTLNLQFAVEPSTYIVRLYFSEKETYFNTHGATVMNVLVDDSIVISNLNISDSINFGSIMSQFKVNESDSLLQLNFQPIKNPIKINGLEILLDYPNNLLDESPAFFAFPNPVIDYLYVVNDEEKFITSWKLSDSSGVLMKKDQVQVAYYQPVLTLDFCDVPTGIYYFTIITSDGVYTQKIIR